MDNSKALVWILVLVMVIVLAGCAVALAKSRGQTKPLTLFAFNYTDRAILDITVDGVWLGSADAYTNGGRAMGPRAPRNRSNAHTVEVTWRVSGLYDMTTDTYSRMPVEEKRASVPLKFPYPDDPNMMLLHFYPDGRVEAELIDRQDNHFDFRRIPIPEGHRRHGSR